MQGQVVQQTYFVCLKVKRNVVVVSVCECAVLCVCVVNFVCVCVHLFRHDIIYVKCIHDTQAYYLLTSVQPCLHTRRQAYPMDNPEHVAKVLPFWQSNMPLLSRGSCEGEFLSGQQRRPVIAFREACKGPGARTTI